MGSQNDFDFLCGMAVCDVVLFPYLEVGQSSSGPISQAIELGCRVIASRTRAFIQLARYHPERIEFFDVGNYLELASRVRASPQYDTRKRPLFNVETNNAIYARALQALPDSNAGDFDKILEKHSASLI